MEGAANSFFITVQFCLLPLILVGGIAFFILKALLPEETKPTRSVVRPEIEVIPRAPEPIYVPPPMPIYVPGTIEEQEEIRIRKVEAEQRVTEKVIDTLKEIQEKVEKTMVEMYEAHDEKEQQLKGNQKLQEKVIRFHEREEAKMELILSGMVVAIGAKVADTQDAPFLSPQEAMDMYKIFELSKQIRDLTLMNGGRR